MTEKMNCTLVNMLVKHADDYPEDWPQRLNYVLLAYRTSVHTTTRFAPFELMFGRKMNDFVSWQQTEEENNEKSIINRSIEIKKLFEETLPEASTNISRGQEKQTSSQDVQLKATDDSLQRGQEVYIKNCKLVKKKFEQNYEGKFLVKAQLPSGNYKLETSKGDELLETYPRWKLKPIGEKAAIYQPQQPKQVTFRENQVQATKCISLEKPTPSPTATHKPLFLLYRIIDSQKVGNAVYKYEIEYASGKRTWICPNDANQSAIAEYRNRTRVMCLREDIDARTHSKKPQHKHGSKKMLSLIRILAFCIILAAFVKAASASCLEEEFAYCQTNEISRIIDANPDCKHPNKPTPWNGKIKTSINEDISFPAEISVASKSRYFLRTIGYQCFSEKMTSYFNMTWYGGKTHAEKREIIELSRLQCLTMIETKTCHNNVMHCIGETCSYAPTQSESYHWNEDSKTTSYACSFRQKEVIGETENSVLFFSPINSCKPRDLSCKLYDSIIVWHNSSLNHCPYVEVHTGRGYNQSSINKNFIFSAEDKLLFEIVEEFYECDNRIYKTTDGLFVIFHNDPKRKEEKIAKYGPRVTFNRQHDLNSLALAENDYNKYDQWLNARKLEKIALYHHCVLLRNQLREISSHSERFNRINDLNGVEIITFTRNNLIYLPYCVKVKSVCIEDTATCTEDQLVSFASQNKSQKGYLTNNNFIKESSDTVNCQLVRSTQMLPSKKKFLIRRANQFSVFNATNMIQVDITKTTLPKIGINFVHHEEITIHTPSDRSTDDDIQGKFYSTPNDDEIQEIVSKSKTLDAIEEVTGIISAARSQITIIQYVVGAAVVFYSLFTLTRSALTHVQQGAALLPHLVVVPMDNRP